MDAITWRRARELFEIALEMSAADREVLLAQECRNAPEVRAEVEELLAASAAAGDYLETPAITQHLGANRGDEDSDQPLPTAIGAYHVIRRLGHGGMGVVYLARPRDAASERV